MDIKRNLAALLNKLESINPCPDEFTSGSSSSGGGTTQEHSTPRTSARKSVKNKLNQVSKHNTAVAAPKRYIDRVAMSTEGHPEVVVHSNEYWPHTKDYNGFVGGVEDNQGIVLEPLLDMMKTEVEMVRNEEAQLGASQLPPLIDD